VTMQRTIVIGDVHGCLEELEALHRALGTTRDDRVVYVGDLVAKGPDSFGVVRFVRESGAASVRGNHEAHLLRFLLPDEGGKPLKPLHRETAARMSPEDWAFVEAMPLTLALPELNLLVVHAGLVPGVALEAQEPQWLMNLRSITPSGAPSKRVDDGVPWASVWSGPQQVVFGHDARRGLQEERWATGLDTGCVYGNRLTALLLPERRFVSVPARRVWCEPRDA
jgi:hypothetical protein